MTIFVQKKTAKRLTRWYYLQQNVSTSVIT